jgi:hypothetical protein
MRFVCAAVRCCDLTAPNSTAMGPWLARVERSNQPRCALPGPTWLPADSESDEDFHTAAVAEAVARNAIEGRNQVYRGAKARAVRYKEWSESGALLRRQPAEMYCAGDVEREAVHGSNGHGQAEGVNGSTCLGQAEVSRQGEAGPVWEAQACPVLCSLQDS